eukprot:SAG31_NODE_13117_length_891_cov_1.503788_1_plen_174_part_01
MLDFGRLPRLRTSVVRAIRKAAADVEQRGNAALSLGSARSKNPKLPICKASEERFDMVSSKHMSTRIRLQQISTLVSTFCAFRQANACSGIQLSLTDLRLQLARDTAQTIAKILPEAGSHDSATTEGEQEREGDTQDSQEDASETCSSSVLQPIHQWSGSSALKIRTETKGPKH